MATRLTFAESLAHGRLFKYRSISDDHPEYVGRIFTHNELHFSAPLSLNDPWESRPIFNVNSNNFDKRRAVEWAFSLMKKGNPTIIERHARDWLNSLTAERFHEYAKQLSVEFQGEMVADLRMSCFSTDPANLLMWAHYGNCHRGICLEFDVKRNELAGAIKVDYTDDYPVLDMFDEDQDALLRSTTLVKSKCWEYESEYRLITRVSQPPGTLRLIDGRYYFPPTALVGVILGCQITEAHRSIVLEWVRAANHEIRIRKARRHDERFELVMEEM